MLASIPAKRAPMVTEIFGSTMASGNQPTIPIRRCPASMSSWAMARPADSSSGSTDGWPTVSSRLTSTTRTSGATRGSTVWRAAIDPKMIPSARMSSIASSALVVRSKWPPDSAISTVWSSWSATSSRPRIIADA